jgi:hypothetical protein
LVRTILLTLIALTAFATNSVLCRLALGTGPIDASSFTVVTLGAGAAVLLVILKAAETGDGFHRQLDLRTDAVHLCRRLRVLEWGGVIVAFGGFVYLSMDITEELH